MFQAPALYAWRTVRRNLMLPLEIMGIPRPEREKRAAQYLEMVGLQDFAGKFPWMLPAPEDNFVDHHPRVIEPKDPNEAPVQHYSIGTQYTNINLPVIKPGCEKTCREPLSGAGLSLVTASAVASPSTVPQAPRASRRPAPCSPP